MTPKKTIYVREEDQEVFDQAKELADEESLSQTIAKALKDLVERKKAEEEGFKEITLEVGTWPAGQKSTKQTEEVKFYGRKLNYHKELHGQTGSGDDRGTTYKLYQGGKGKFLYYVRNWSRWQKESSGAKYELFDSLEELEDEKNPPRGFIADAKKKLGQDGAKRLEI